MSHLRALPVAATLLLGTTLAAQPRDARARARVRLVLDHLEGASRR